MISKSYLYLAALYHQVGHVPMKERICSKGVYAVSSTPVAPFTIPKATDVRASQSPEV